MESGRRGVIRGCRPSVIIAAGSFCDGSDRGRTPGTLGEVRRVIQAQELPRIFRQALTRARTLLGQHRVFATAAAVAALPRALAMLGYQPVLLVRLDSYDYLWGAAHLSPNLINVSGYSVFLWLLRPLHSLAAIALVQHAMGLAVAAMVYALLRRYGLPAWGATLAAAPVLFDPGQLMAEQLVMADLLAMTLMMAGLTVLLIPRAPSWPASVIAGLLTGASATVRPTALPLIVLVPAYLLVREGGWRRVAGWLRGGVA